MAGCRSIVQEDNSSERTTLGPLEEDTLTVMENLALSYRLRGKNTLRQAAEQYEKVLRRRKENLDSSRSVLSPLENKDYSKEKLQDSEKHQRWCSTIAKLVEDYEVMKNTTRCWELHQEQLSYLE